MKRLPVKVFACTGMSRLPPVEPFEEAGRKAFEAFPDGFCNILNIPDIKIALALFLAVSSIFTRSLRALVIGWSQVGAEAVELTGCAGPGIPL